MRSLLAALLLIANCQRAEDRHLKRVVRPEELVGQWVMTPRSVQDLKDVGHSGPIDPSHHTITIRADRTCHFRTFRSVWPAGPLIDSPCRWELRQLPDIQQLVIDVSAPSGVTNYYHFTEQKGVLVLWQDAADPDAWLYVEYRKQ